jgi:hypothetical protein
LYRFLEHKTIIEQEGDAMKLLKSRKILTMITVLALLLLIIPAGALFAESMGGGKPQATTSEIQQQDEEQQETEETEDLDENDAEEPGSENAAVVAERIQAAEQLGITPGHLNLIDKLFALTGGENTPEALAIFRSEWALKTPQEINQEASRLRFAARGQEFPGNPQNGQEPIETGDETDGDGVSHGRALAKGHNK